MLNHKEVSLIVGTGAVENAWVPVIKALQPLYPFNLTGDSINCYFARLVYLLRWYASLDNKEFSRQQTKVHLEFLNALKIKIANELITAQKLSTIKIRQEFKEVITKFLFPKENKSIVISTNWDTVLEDAINNVAQTKYPIKGGDVEVHYIHGNVLDPSTMYLPSEVTREPYRSKEEDQMIGTIHGDIWRSLENSNISIIYGLSISPLDAELSQTLAAGWDSDKLEEIIIIDPDHKIISHRVKLLLNPNRRISICAYEPWNLDSKIIYSV